MNKGFYKNATFYPACQYYNHVEKIKEKNYE